jgi:hypothetical protein
MTSWLTRLHWVYLFHRLRATCIVELEYPLRAFSTDAVKTKRPCADAVPQSMLVAG